jgi:hypothetical protein
MKLTQKITLACGLLVAGAGYAQTTTTSNGLLGQRYAELDFSAQNLKFVSDHAWGLEAGVNTPLVPNAVDVGASLGYNWLDEGVDLKAWTLGAYTTVYAPLGNVKPFLSLGVAWQQTKARFVGDDDGALWGARVGFEVPVGALTLTPRISYADDFENTVNSSQQWTYEVEGNYWLNAKTAVFGSVGKTDVVRSPLESWNYTLGVRFRF